MSMPRPALALPLVLALVLAGMPAGCSPASKASAGDPTSRCADLVARAVTSYYNVDGAGRCVRLRDGLTVADADLADFTAEPPPVFDRIDSACGYHPRDHTFTYLVSNADDQAGGRLVILVDSGGWVLNVAKRLYRRPNESTHVSCPAPTDSYVFHG
jgi:hypothetical protein